MGKSYFIVCIYYILPFICWWIWVVFTFLATLNKAEMNIASRSMYLSPFSIICIYMYEWDCQVTWYFLFIFLKNCQTVFHSGCIILHFHQWYIKVSIFFTYLSIHLFIFVLVITIISGVKWHFIEVLICIYLMTQDINHLFICILAICISSLNGYLFNVKFFAHFKLRYLFFYLNFRKFLVYAIY